MNLSDEQRLKLKELKDKIKLKKENESTVKEEVSQPRYDDVYYEGLSWLDSLR